MRNGTEQPARRKGLWIRLLLSVGLLLILLVTVDLQETKSIIGRAEAVYLWIAVLVAFGDRVLMASKWRLLFDGATPVIFLHLIHLPA